MMFLAVNTAVPSKTLSPTLVILEYPEGSDAAVVPACVQTSVAHPGAPTAVTASPMAW